jgi:ribose 5-phosphate isomerase A
MSGATAQDDAKRAAADYAASMVEDGTIIGLGTGSTAAHFIDALIERARLGLSILCIPTSERSAERAREGGLALTDFAAHPVIDLAVDGADEIARGTLDLIKGLGGALLREKIVAAAARRFVVIADASKLVDRLGARTPVPVEIDPFGWQTTRDRLARLGATPALRGGETTPTRTDGGNLILDCAFGPIADPAALAARLSATLGVVEHGLFPAMTHLALVADATGVHRHEAG